MRQVHLMRSLPRTKRNIGTRKAARTRANVEIARRFGRDYFDGSRDTGYGGYSYDGRWIPVAREIIEHFGLGPGSRVLDVGCAKGFLVKDLIRACPGLEAFGVDVSEYALMNCDPEVVGRVHLGTCERLQFPDRSFDAVIAKDVIHNLNREGCVQSVREIERLAPGCGFIQVDSYRTPEEKRNFSNWVLTARTHYDPEGWLQLFGEAGYTGDYDWTVIE
jgi:ubiquinone/menaquinone biosynthesis C-methylase UbiE